MLSVGVAVEGGAPIRDRKEEGADGGGILFGSLRGVVVVGKGMGMGMGMRMGGGDGDGVWVGRWKWEWRWDC